MRAFLTALACLALVPASHGAIIYSHPGPVTPVLSNIVLGSVPFSNTFTAVLELTLTEVLPASFGNVFFIGTGANDRFALYTTPGAAQLYAGVSTVLNGGFGFSPAGVLTLNQPAHIAIVVGTANITFYVNGVNAGSATPGPAIALHGPLYFSSPFDSPALGTFRNFALYNQALSASEVQALASAPEPGTWVLTAFGLLAVAHSRRGRTPRGGHGQHREPAC